jgi:hypothetical protein
MLRCVSNGVTTIKPGYQINGNARVMWSDEFLHAVPYVHQEEFTFGEHPRKPTIRNACFQQ